MCFVLLLSQTLESRFVSRFSSLLSDFRCFSFLTHISWNFLVISCNWWHLVKAFESASCYADLKCYSLIFCQEFKSSTPIRGISLRGRSHLSNLTFLLVLSFISLSLSLSLLFSLDLFGHFLGSLVVKVARKLIFKSSWVSGVTILFFSKKLMNDKNESFKAYWNLFNSWVHYYEILSQWNCFPLNIFFCFCYWILLSIYYIIFKPWGDVLLLLLLMCCINLLFLSVPILRSGFCVDFFLREKIAFNNCNAFHTMSRGLQGIIRNENKLEEWFKTNVILW